MQLLFHSSDENFSVASHIPSTSMLVFDVLLRTLLSTSTVTLGYSLALQHHLLFATLASNHVPKHLLLILLSFKVYSTKYQENTISTLSSCLTLLLNHLPMGNKTNYLKEILKIK